MPRRLLVIFGHACQRKLVDVHVAREIVQHVRQARHRCVEGLAGISDLLDQIPFIGFGGRDAAVQPENLRSDRGPRARANDAIRD